MPSGNPNSRMARAGFRKGRRPPRVKALAMKRGGICHGEKEENAPEAVVFERLNCRAYTAVSSRYSGDIG